jgi:hypothetical protein
MDRVFISLLLNKKKHKKLASFPALPLFPCPSSSPVMNGGRFRLILTVPVHHVTTLLWFYFVILTLGLALTMSNAFLLKAVTDCFRLLCVGA